MFFFHHGDTRIHILSVCLQLGPAFPAFITSTVQEQPLIQSVSNWCLLWCRSTFLRELIGAVLLVGHGWCGVAGMEGLVLDAFAGSQQIFQRGGVAAQRDDQLPANITAPTGYTVASYAPSGSWISARSVSRSAW